MTFGRRVFIGQLAVAVLAVGLLGARPQRPTFGTTTRLVEVTVAVVDKKGNGVAGLGPADFVVRDEGKSRPVDVFRFDGAIGASGAWSQAVAPPGVFTNLPAYQETASRSVTALVLDNITMTPTEGVKARDLMMRYLTALAPRTLTGVYLMADKVYVLHDFTDNQEALLARIRKTDLPTATAWDMDYRGSVVEAEGLLKMLAGADAETYGNWLTLLQTSLRADALADAQIRREWMERSLASIEALGRHLAGIPGRKSVVWIGGGVSWVSITATVPAGGASSPQRQIGAAQRAMPQLMENNEEKVRQVARRLAQQGIVLYIVDAHYLQAPSDTKAQSRQPVPLTGRGNFEMLMNTQAVSSDTQAPMEAMAAVTGGRYFLPGDTTGAAKILGDMQGSYTLGFYMPESPDSKWHKLKVEVKRPGLNVRHREGYLADSPVPQAGRWGDERWQAVLSSPLASPSIPLTATGTRMPSGELTISVLAETSALDFVRGPAQRTANLEVFVGDRGPQGLAQATRSAVTSIVAEAEWETKRQQPTRYDGTWKPSAGATVLRVVVHDMNNGRYGSVDVPLNKVPDAASK